MTRTVPGAGRRRWLGIFAFLALAAALMARPAQALDPATTGVVVMHGKWGNTDSIWPLAQTLRRAGFLVATPNMPWSGSRRYDHGFTEAMGEIDAAAAHLKAEGARRIVVAGHSLGANAALHYASLGRPLAAAVLIAPGQFPDGAVMRGKDADDLATAKAMVAAGKGNETRWFTDYNNGGRSRSIRMRASVYLSYYAPRGPAAMSVSAARIGATPILWVAPTADHLTDVFARLVRPHFPATAHVERIDVVADHLGAPTAARTRIVNWLKALPAPAAR